MNVFTSIQLSNFKAYLRVQKSGRYNMFDPQARRATGLTEDGYLFVMKNYSELAVALSLEKGAAA